jgi:hypothetical protein
MLLSELLVFEALLWWGKGLPRRRLGEGGLPNVLNACAEEIAILLSIIWLDPIARRAAGISCTTARRVLGRNQRVDEREANFLRE